MTSAAIPDFHAKPSAPAALEINAGSTDGRTMPRKIFARGIVYTRANSSSFGSTSLTRDVYKRQINYCPLFI